MTSEIRVLNVKEGTESRNTFLNWLLKFRYDDLIFCPKDVGFDYRSKKEYTANEQRILDLLYNTKNGRNPICPTVCTGRRGDGSRYGKRCKFFKGYGNNKEEVWNFRSPQGYVNCSKVKSGKIHTQKLTTYCKRRELALAVARKLKLIHEFGCGCLQYTSIKECFKCSHKTVNGCDYKVKCKKGEHSFIWTDCEWGDCDTCPDIREKVK